MLCFSKGNGELGTLTEWNINHERTFPFILLDEIHQDI